LHKEVPEVNRGNTRPLLEIHAPAEFERLREETVALRIDFIQTDLELGVTFADMAAEALNGGKRARNKRNARRAYDTVFLSFSRLSLKGPIEREIRERLAYLRLRLESLGESF
jgi:hypothetical protein